MTIDNNLTKCQFAIGQEVIFNPNLVPNAERRGQAARIISSEDLSGYAQSGCFYIVRLSDGTQESGVPEHLLLGSDSS
jgi:hypothetical protein